jgi:hypothetical protein
LTYQLVLGDGRRSNRESKEGVGDALDAGVEFGRGQASGSTGYSNSADRHCSNWSGVGFSWRRVRMDLWRTVAQKTSHIYKIGD